MASRPTAGSRRPRAVSCACGCTRPGGPRIHRRPEQGESAIEKLVDALVELRGLPLPIDPDLGATFYTVGLIEGGVAPNVVPAQASAEVMFRTIGSADDILAVASGASSRG